MRGLTLSLILLAVGCGGSDDSPAAVTDTGAAGDTSTGGDTSPGGDTGGGDDVAPADTGTAGETSGEDAAGVKCGSTVCGMGEVCCASGDPDAGFMLTCAKGTCPDGGATLSCDGPEDCPAGANICCAKVKVTGSLPACSFSSGVAECSATCDSNIPKMCPDDATVRRCHAKADCTETDYTKCCLFKSGGTEAEFCVDELVALAAESCK